MRRRSMINATCLAVAFGMGSGTAWAANQNINNSVVWVNTLQTAKWESGKFTTPPSNQVKACGDIQYSTQDRQSYVSTVRDLDWSPDITVASRAFLHLDPPLCSGYSAQAQGNVFYTRATISYESPTRGGWASTRD